jgi:uncharacterized membrane protein
MSIAALRRSGFRCPLAFLARTVQTGANEMGERMELGIKLVLWVHLVSLALAGCSGFAIPAVLGLMTRAEAAQKPAFGMAIAKLAALARMALVLLILSGTFLLWAKYGGFAGLNGWFHLKLTLVAILTALVLFNLFNAKWARAGDMAAAARMPLLAKAGTGLLLAIVFAAVFAFS